MTRGRVMVDRMMKRLGLVFALALSLAFSGNYMDGHYSDYHGCVPYTAQDGSNRCDTITGKPLDRQPKVQYRFTPAYTIPTDWGSLKLWTTYEYVGNRYGD